MSKHKTPKAWTAYKIAKVGSSSDSCMARQRRKHWPRTEGIR